jgi:homopolymeric O-antigen transport system permease protein
MPSLVAECKEMLSEQISYRDLLVQMTKRDLLLRYKQTVMGFGWAVFMPLMNTAVFSVLFKNVAKFQTPVPYPVFAFCGLWVWNFFSSALRFSVTSLTSNPNLVTKVYFPREIFPFSTVLVCLVDFAVGAIVLVGLMIWYHVPVGIHLAWFPLVLLVHVMFTAAVALIVSMANLFYRDVKYLFEVIIQVWLFGSSALYPADQLEGVIGTIVRANPMTPIIDSYRNVILLDANPSPAFLGAAVFSVLALFVAWLLFHHSEFQFAESI